MCFSVLKFPCGFLCILLFFFVVVAEKTFFKVDAHPWANEPQSEKPCGTDTASGREKLSLGRESGQTWPLDVSRTRHGCFRCSWKMGQGPGVGAEPSSSAQGP